MAKYAKWIGAGLGFAFAGGPIGALIGYALGSMFDRDNEGDGHAFGGGSGRVDQDFRRRYADQRHRTSPQDFAASLMVLSAAVMKADGKHLKSELDYIRKFFSQQFGDAVAAEQIGILKELLKKDIPVRQVCMQIKYLMQHPMRLQLLQYLFGIAQADGHVDQREVDLLKQIAAYLGISQKDYASIEAMFYKDVADAYTVLEIDAKATDTDVKRAYRRMANKYHPDKVADLGAEHQKAAEAKFIKVQEAYEQIKKERGMK